MCTHTTRSVSLSIPACVNPMIQLGFYLPQISCSRKIPVELAQVPLEFHQEPSGQCKHLLEFHANFATWPWLCASYWFCSQLCAKKCHLILGSALLQSAVGICQLHSFNCSAPLLLHMAFQFKKIHLLLSILLFFFVNEYNTHLVLITFSRNDRMSEILMNFPFSIPQFSHRLICIADYFWMLNHIPLKFPPSHIWFLYQVRITHIPYWMILNTVIKIWKCM